MLWLVAVSLATVSTARAADDGDAPDATLVEEAGADAKGAEDPAVLELERKTADVRALVAGDLEPTILAGSLFDVSLDDENLIRVEASRLRDLFRTVDERADRAGKRTRPRAPLDDGGVDPVLWHARIELDRARLAFYELPVDRRRELLAAQATREPDAGVALTGAERRVREEEEQRLLALAAAHTARTEGERLVSSDLARLLDVERAQSAFEEKLARDEKDIAEQADLTLGWEQRALETRAHPGPAVDAIYEALRHALRSAREALSDALDQLSSAPSEVPVAGPDALADLHVEVDTTEARAERARVEASAHRLEVEQERIRRQRAAQLFDEIDTLNRERLGLLGSLSSSKRAAVTGFTMAGWEQAKAEVRQLALILRYHRYVIGEWLLVLRHPSRALGTVLAGGAIEALEWLLALSAFVWWRRRSAALLRLLHRRAEEDDRRLQLPEPSPASRLLAISVQVHRPLEWLSLLFVLRWFLPARTQAILEVHVPLVFMMWIFGAAFVVDVVNALAGAGRAKGPPLPDELQRATLRLRSLRLVARVIVVFGLILVISSMLVGRGTIFQWVFSTSWLASIPVLLVLVSWWRPTVFQRTECARKPSAIQRWVLANRTSWSTSFAAAAVGGIYLFGSGATRAARNWIGRFVITRRALAYLFRRQLDKREHKSALGPLDDAAFAAMGPERPSASWISNDSDIAIDRLGARIRQREGGVIAIVGERGSGKSTALARLVGHAADAILLQARSSDAEALCAQFATRLGLATTPSFAETAAALAASPKIHAMLLDDAHHFVRPVMGGLATFDSFLAEASRHASRTTWVFALDHVIWPFLDRARGARPLFDEVIRLGPWREEEIVRLLEARTGQAGMSPSFESLLEPLPTAADEVDKQEALAQRAADYYRLLWDAATGNPGVVLHMWRCSLGTDDSGKTAVRPLSTLDTADLERLPDSAVFVLRAVLQLAPVGAEQIAKGTLIRAADVDDAIRYAASRGYIEEHGGGYRVTWTWFRAITLFLQRKHLLVTR
jgi:hypothetical protein